MALRKVMAVAVVALLLVATAVAAEGRWRRRLKLASDLSWGTVVHEGVVRDFGWYAGAEVGSAPAPVVLILHGGGGSAVQVWSGDHGQAWRRLADEHGLVLILPEGRVDPGKPGAHHWNDCRSEVLEPDAASDADDVGFLRSVVAWSGGRWPVDRDRVYVTGPSNGGMMTYRLAMEAPDMVAAAAAVIANLPDPSECGGPFRSVPMLIMNGTDDPLMPWDGGCVVGPRCERGAVRSTEETVAFWVAVNRAGSEATCSDLPDSAPDDGSTVSVCSYDGGIGGGDVVLYRIDGGGHAVPGPDPLPFWYSLIVGRKNHDVCAAEEIWAFFERHRRFDPPPRRPAGRAGR